MADGIVEPWITAADLAGCPALDGATGPEITTAIQWASTFAFEVSDRSVGLLSATRVFCPMSCTCFAMPLSRQWSSGTYQWAFGGECQCLPGRRIDLGTRSVVDVTAVTYIDVNGAETVKGLELFHVISRQYLARIDGGAWLPAAHKVKVGYRTGVVPDVFDMDAVMALACEKLKSIRNQPCALPDGMESYTTGSGGRVKMVDPFDKRLKGLPSIPRFYQWALTKFEHAAGGILDPADCVSSYTVSWVGEVAEP